MASGLPRRGAARAPQECQARGQGPGRARGLGIAAPGRRCGTARGRWDRGRRPGAGRRRLFAHRRAGAAFLRTAGPAPPFCAPPGRRRLFAHRRAGAAFLRTAGPAPPFCAPPGRRRLFAHRRAGAAFLRTAGPAPPFCAPPGRRRLFAHRRAGAAFLRTAGPGGPQAPFRQLALRPCAWRAPAAAYPGRRSMPLCPRSRRASARMPRPSRAAHETTPGAPSARRGAFPLRAAATARARGPSLLSGAFTAAGNAGSLLRAAILRPSRTARRSPLQARISAAHARAAGTRHHNRRAAGGCHGRHRSGRRGRLSAHRTRPLADARSSPRRPASRACTARRRAPFRTPAPFPPRPPAGISPSRPVPSAPPPPPALPLPAYPFQATRPLCRRPRPPSCPHGAPGPAVRGGNAQVCELEGRQVGQRKRPARAKRRRAVGNSAGAPRNAARNCRCRDPAGTGRAVQVGLIRAG